MTVVAMTLRLAAARHAGRGDRAAPAARSRRLGALTVVALLVLAPRPGAGQAGEGRELVVGASESAPFAMKQPDGSWRGISIELWRELAAELGLRYRIEERSLEGLLAGLEDGSLDVAAAALTTTEERELLFDFTHPFFLSGLAIAVPAGDDGWLSLGSFASRDFLRLATLLVGGMLAASLGILAFERSRNPEQFGGPGLRSLGEAFWWAAVTMTTVGYGDRAPRTLGGRAVAGIWMLGGVALISAFTATIASNLTVKRIGGDISGPEDLVGRRVGSVAGSTSEDYLEARGIAPISLETSREAVQALMDGRVDALVYDEPILRHLAISVPEVRMEVLPQIIASEAYAFGTATNSPWREQLDRAVLRQIEFGSLAALVERYVGR